MHFGPPMSLGLTTSGGRFRERDEAGFTLVELMAVMIIIGILAAIAIPKLTAGADTARRNADIATAHELKSALDRFQVENGVYPKTSELSVDTFGKVTGGGTAAGFIPKYINRLDASTTQQKPADAANKGFGVEELRTDWSGYHPGHLIMVFLTPDGSTAEVAAYDATLTHVLWTSAQ
ncbi:type II secretion system protein G precursor [Peptococcaceae bacterium CEB3]|nr:type II secretion system protein G precursor [Peptococcaceae bacterium CEB3]